MNVRCALCGGPAPEMIPTHAMTPDIGFLHVDAGSDQAFGTCSAAWHAGRRPSAQVRAQRLGLRVIS